MARLSETHKRCLTEGTGAPSEALDVGVGEPDHAPNLFWGAWMMAEVRGKHGNIRKEVDGILFHSKKEAERYGELKMRQRAKDISDLKWQVRIPLMVGSIKVGVYIADFVYNDRTGKQIIEDTKGGPTRKGRHARGTDVYRLKKKILAANGIEVYET